MAQTTKTDKQVLAQQRRARLAAELRSNLGKRKQQARARAQRAGDAARGNDERKDEREVSQGPREQEGEAG